VPVLRVARVAGIVAGGVLAVAGTANRALGTEPAHWTSDAVSAKSAQFARAQSRDAEAYAKAEDALDVAKRDVAALDAGVALLGSPPELASYALAVRKRLAGEFLRLQRHSDLLTEDYERTFRSAISRALPSVSAGFALAECTPSAAPGPRVGSLGMGAFARPLGSGCPGTDLSPAVARAIDADPQLKADVGSMLAVEWPRLDLPGSAQAVVPLGGTETGIQVVTLVRALAGDAMTEATDSYEAEVEQLSDGLDDDDAVVKKNAIAEAQAARGRWEAAMAAVGKKVIDRAKGKLAKGAFARAGLCANPARLGGCGVKDVTEGAVALLAK
jgi:hypothetical protein